MLTASLVTPRLASFLTLSEFKYTNVIKYQDWAWDAFLAINSTCHVGSGYSGIENVNIAGGDGFDNVQESFLFAEVLKYSYMIHAEGKFYESHICKKIEY